MLNISDLLKPENGEQSFLRKPTEVGRFSLDGERLFHHDRRQMTCLVMPKVSRNKKLNFNLNDGFETERFVKRDEDVKERLDHLLMWMQINKDRFVHKDEGRSSSHHTIGNFPDFVLWRGHLTKFMCTPYENRDGWMMAAQKLGDTIYISEIETEAAKERKKQMTLREKTMTFWGVRFEGYMTGPFPKPGSEPELPLPACETVINTNMAFCSVLRSRLNGRHSLIYGAEVDCCEPVEVLSPPDCYIELKTSRVFTSKRQEENFYRYKALKWWAQSYLAGIPQIICGFRDDNGYVSHIENFRTEIFPQRAENLHNSWNWKTCLTFLDRILSCIKRFYQQQELCDMCILTFEPGNPCIRCESSNSCKDGFLPQWYIDKMKK
uniref:Decapping nuclease n=1 Tax=Phallusia mammillata TaxID=59560 RepID=A0A6F9DAW1_9ASCI|nr:decapping and exoribonuclease protein [Phallusia mammillata]